MSFTQVECPQCGCNFCLSATYYNNLIKTHQHFYCPNGHGLWHPKQEEEAVRSNVKQSTSAKILQLIKPQKSH